ncbi:MAG: rhodanese-like domain-containing protein, partial [Betaproteobacteria bacterium]
TGPVAGAIRTDFDRLAETVRDWPKDQLIVTMCACPQDASAIKAAHLLLKRGYRSVRPLRGGYEAWVAASSNP